MMFSCVFRLASIELIAPHYEAVQGSLWDALNRKSDGKSSKKMNMTYACHFGARTLMLNKDGWG